MTDNIVKFPDIKDKVHILKFKVPAVIRMSREADSDIALEIERLNPTEGIGQAWVPAKNMQEAKKKLHKMIQVTEWIDDA
ncbi:MAG: hypothetical protein CMP33_07700 [Rickettsiales bacterium]|nr:hypothetical protein [Rickettsiales bacterium]|tara:strand:- start:282 stop:521 length:240 start_codon:yes stop_codon:yes gene_type:complete